MIILKLYYSIINFVLVETHRCVLIDSVKFINPKSYTKLPVDGGEGNDTTKNPATILPRFLPVKKVKSVILISIC